MSKYLDPSTITIDLSHHPPRTPLGIMLAPAATSPPSTSTTTPPPSPTSNTTVILAGWNRIPDTNKLGPIQKLGPVRIGDRLVAINNVDVREMEFRHVLDLLNGMIMGKDGSGFGGRGNDGTIPLKSLGFAPFFLPPSSSSSLPRKKTGGNFGSYGAKSFLSSLIWSRSGGTEDRVGTAVHAVGRGRDGTAWSIARNRQLYAFASTIRRIRKNHGTAEAVPSASDADGPTGRHEAEAPFVQYEIVCRLTVRSANNANTNNTNNNTNNNNDKLVSWSVWKRYSEFQSLDDRLRRIFGCFHATDPNGGSCVSFPPPHHLRRAWAGVWSGTADGGGGGCRNTRLWQKRNLDRGVRGGTTSAAGADDGGRGTTLHQKFVRKRREELKDYWGAVGNCEEMFDFADPSLHRYSRDMAAFLELERYFPRSAAAGGGGGKRSVISGGGGGGSNSVSSSLGIRHRNYNAGSAVDMDASTVVSQQSSSLYGQSVRSNLPLGGNHGGEIILTEKSIETLSLPTQLSSRGAMGRKQKRTANATKPAFQRRLMDSL